jgi:glyoxylase-like metal-dependent hydrolase (beta-lactamase superfamily II)
MGFGHAVPADGLGWLTLTIGHLSANKFWGETERRRGPLCTSTLIKCPGGLVLVDPPVFPPDIPRLLMDQAGIEASEVSHVFLTHFHGDHRYGLEAFPSAVWLMARPEIDYARQSAGPAEASLLDRTRPAGDEVSPGLRVVHTPGHTPGLSSLVFSWRGRRVAVCGDAVMTEDHFRAREGHSNSTDFAQATATLERLAESVDVVIPGHGAAFDVAWCREVGR